MYIRDLVSSVTRPVKELKGFQKVSLTAGRNKTVALEITPESLAFYDINMKYVVEPGEFEIMVGNSSRDEDLQKVILTVTEIMDFATEKSTERRCATRTGTTRPEWHDSTTPSTSRSKKKSVTRWATSPPTFSSSR